MNIIQSFLWILIICKSGMDSKSYPSNKNIENAGFRTDDSQRIFLHGKED